MEMHELLGRLGGRPVHGPEDLGDVLVAHLAHRPAEALVAVVLDSARRPVLARVVGLGTIDGAPVDPRAVLGPAVARGAAGVIVAHNHPSGHLAPTEADMAATMRLISAGDILGVPLFDHLIVAEQGWRSLRESSRLWGARLRGSSILSVPPCTIRAADDQEG